MPFCSMASDEVEVVIVFDADELRIGRETRRRDRENIFVEALLNGFKHPFLHLILSFPQSECDRDF